MKRMTYKLVERAAPCAARTAVQWRRLAGRGVSLGAEVGMICKFRLLLSVGISLLMASLPGAATAADADTKGEHVLFIGNSFTEAHNLPGIVRLIADANGAAINTDVAPMNEATLDAIPGKPEHQEKIKSRRWDAIVLEPYSTGPIFEVHKTIKGAAHVTEMCHTARFYVFATWAYASEERFLEQTDALKKAEEGTIVLDEYKDMYKNMQMLLNVGAAQVATAAKTVKINKRNKGVKTAVVPVGSVWQAALRKHTDWQLHDRDGYHPSKAGSYLSALVFYRVLLGHLPEKAAKEWLDQGWIDQATHDKMIAVIQSMPDGTFPADGKDPQTK